jgi:hypothetical protein
MNLLKIITATDGTVTRALVNFATEEEAMAALYYEMWYASSNENTQAVVCEIISDDGQLSKCERFNRFIPEENESEGKEA